MNVVHGNNFLGPKPFFSVFRNAHLVRGRGDNRWRMSRQLLNLPQLCMKNRDRVIKPVALSFPPWPRDLIKVYAAHSAQIFNSLSTEHLFLFLWMLHVWWLGQLSPRNLLFLMCCQRRFCAILFRSRTVCDDDGDDEAYFSSYAHFGIHEEMLKVSSSQSIFSYVAMHDI